MTIKRCGYVRCQQPVIYRRLVLLRTDGTRQERARPLYCNEHLEALASNLIQTYTGTGAPCYLLEPVPAPSNEHEAEA